MEVTLDVGEIIEKTKLIFKNPEAFFKKYKKESGWQKAFAFYGVTTLVGGILTFLFVAFVFPLFKTQIEQIVGQESINLNTVDILTGELSNFIFGLALSFVFGYAVKLWLRIFGVSTSFESAYRTITYARVPTYLLNWLPFVNLIALIYSFVMIYKGFRVNYEMPKRKAIIAVATGVIASVLGSYLLILLLVTYS